MTAASLKLTDHQYQNALNIIAAVKARGWPIKAAYIAMEAALDEAGLRMLASANVPASQKYPNDGLGYDHASMNFFQQQTGYAWAPANEGRYQPNPTMQMSTMDSPNGWGTPAELMNAETATSKFLDELARVPWRSMTNWDAAQAVQHSEYADGSNYRAEDARAQQIVNALWDEGEFTLDAEAKAAFAALNTKIDHDIGEAISGDKTHLTNIAHVLQTVQAEFNQLKQLVADVAAIKAKVGA